MRTRTLGISRLLAVAALFSTPAIAQQPVFARAEPFLGARYGMSYDMSARAAARSGRPCVTFDASKTTRESDGGAKNQVETVTRSLDLVRTMNLSADAQIKSLSGIYEARSTLEVADKSEVHLFSESKFFYSYRLNDTVMLLTESISILPDYVGLLKKGVAGLDEFRAKCGNAFVIGQQAGEYYYATAFKSSETKSSNMSTKLDFSFTYRGGYNADLLATYATMLTTQQKSETLKVANATSNPQLGAPNNADEAQKQWTDFRPTGTSGKTVNVVVAPYTVASGALPEGLMSGNPDEKKLETMLEALWDLKALKDAANFVLRRPEEFALGLPKTTKRDERLRDVRRLHKEWSSEFDKLLPETKKCVQSFTEDCRLLSVQYESNPRISQTTLLPKKYGSACYHHIEVSQGNEDSAGGEFKLVHTGPGDTEMGGGPVRVNATLSLRADGSRLFARVDVTAQEDKADRSTFKGSKEVEIFSISPRVPLPDNPWEECQFANAPISQAPISAPATYGAAKFLSGRSPHDPLLINGTGLLTGIECLLDTRSDDRTGLKCSTPRLASVRPVLVNRLDVEAQAWGSPVAPTGWKFWKPDLKGIGTLKP